jgi:hypothetical protein
MAIPTTIGGVGRPLIGPKVNRLGLLDPTLTVIPENFVSRVPKFIETELISSSEYTGAAR